MARQKRRGPGKYHDWITEDGLKKLEAWARDGLTDEQIAKNIGIIPNTLYTWQNKYKEVKEALKRGKEVVDIEVENALLKRALGYEYEEEEITQQVVDGRETVRRKIIKKKMAPDTTAQIFWLKNRKPEMWRDVNRTEISGSIETTTTDPFKDIATEDIKKMIQNAKG